jgi:hypothetical protein
LSRKKGFFGVFRATFWRLDGFIGGHMRGVFGGISGKRGQLRKKCIETGARVDIILRFGNS